VIEENKIKKIDEEELNFLLEELKKIDAEIKMNRCTNIANVEKQLKFCELRKIIKVEIDELIKKMTKRPGKVL